MTKYALVIISFFFMLTAVSQKKYKQLMKDNSINFYDVVAEAEVFFKTHDKNVKGSGWKGYQRWKNANEYKYYPSGKRDNLDPFFTQNAYSTFLKENKVPQQRSSFDNGWEELGPTQLSNLTGHYSAGLGRIEDHYVDPNNENRMYVGSRSGGFWKTLDGGQNWTVTTDYLIATGVNTITVSPTNPEHILINVRNAGNGNSHAIFRSINGGDTWQETNFNPANVGFGGLGDDFKIYKIRYHPTVANLVFIGTSEGVYKSTDNLQSTNWTRLITNGDITEIAFHSTNPFIIYLYDAYYYGANQNQVLRSVNQGVSYSPSNVVPGNNSNRSVHLSVSNSCANCLFFASDNGVWKSSDNGMNFTFLNNPDESCGGFAVNDTDHTKMIYGYVDIYNSLNEGTSFNQATRWSLGNTNGDTTTNQTSFDTSTNYVHADLHPAKSVNGVFYVGTDGLFCKSEDNGLTWEIIGQGIAVRENYKLGVSQSNHYRSISGSQDNGTSIKTESGWVEFYGADGMEGIIHPLNDNLMIGSLQSGGRRKTIDGGLSQFGVTPSGTGDGADWEAPICYDPNNQMTVYDFRTNVFKSEDFGNTWTNLNSPPFAGTIDEVAIAENNSNIIIATYYNQIKKSIDGGLNWSSIQSNLPNGLIQDVAFDPKNDNTIIVTYATYQNNGQKIYISNNGGSSWNNITYNLGNLPIRTVVIDHSADSNIYLGSEIGVYTKPMNSNNWILYNSNLANTTIEELEIVYGSNTLKAATWGRGLWEYSLVGRNDYPSIIKTDITNMPSPNQPKFGIDQIITSTIEYDGTLTNVHVAWSMDNPLFTSTIPMTNTSGDTWVSNSAIPEYPVGTKIYFKVIATGSNNDTSETYKFMYTVKPFEYCDAQSNSAGYEHITNVLFNTINNTSVASNYSNFTTINTIVNRGNTYNLSVSYSNDYNSDQVTAWIDFNGNAEFGDDGEEFVFPVTSGANSPITLPIQIPNDAKLGLTRMRIRLDDTNSGSNNTSCNNSSYGEVEDYAIEIIGNTANVLENNFLTDLLVFPNPTQNELNIDLGKNYSNVTITVNNILGQQIIDTNYTELEQTKLNLNSEPGVYIIQIKTESGKNASIKVIITE